MNLTNEDRRFLRLMKIDHIDLAAALRDERAEADRGAAAGDAVASGRVRTGASAPRPGRMAAGRVDCGGGPGGRGGDGWWQ